MHAQLFKNYPSKCQYDRVPQSGEGKYKQPKSESAFSNEG